MKNEIKKIILSLDESGTKLEGFVVVRESIIEKYGYGEMKQGDLNCEYSKTVLELREQHKDKVSGLDDQASINKLNKLGFIEKSKKDFITGIVCYTDDEENINKFEVEYTNSKKEVKVEDCYDEEDCFNNFKKQIIEMCKFYGLKVNKYDDLSDEVLEKLVDMGLLKKEKLSKTNAKPVSSDEDNNIILPTNTKNSSKIKNFILRHPAISILAGGTVLCAIAMIPGCSKKNKTSEPVVTFAPVNVIETPVPVYTPEPVEEIALQEMPCVEPDYLEDLATVEPVEYLKEIYIEGEDDIFTYYKEPGSDSLLMRGINEYVYFDSSLEEMINIRNQNMSSIGDNVQSNVALEDEAFYIYFENMFNGNMRDKAFVKYFSMMGNEIIKNAYVTENQKLIQDYAKLSGLEVLKLICDDVPLRVYICGCEDYIRFNELSREAKETVLDIAWANNLVLNRNNHDYKTPYQSKLGENSTVPEFTYNGIWYTKSDIGDRIMAKAEELNMIR